MRTHAANHFIAALVAIGVFCMLGCSGLFPTPVENSAASKEIRKCLTDDFARPDHKTVWYDDIVDLSVRGNTIVVTTDLGVADQKSKSICAAVASCVIAVTKNPSGLGTIRVYGQDGQLLSQRIGIDGQCS